MKHQWIHKHVALQQCKELGFRPVVFNINGKLITGYVDAEDEDWPRHAASRNACEVICGVTAAVLWSDNGGAA